MTRPSDIPRDVLAAAKKAAYATEQTGEDGAAITSLIGVDVVARAIFAERERCAAIADGHAQVLRGNFDRNCAIAVEGVATAIRKGAQ